MPDGRNPSRKEPISSIQSVSGEWTIIQSHSGTTVRYLFFFCGNSLRLSVGAPLTQLGTVLHHSEQRWTSVWLNLPRSVRSKVETCYPQRAVIYPLVFNNFILCGETSPYCSIRCSIFSSCSAQTSSLYFIKSFRYIWDFSWWLAVVISLLS